MRIFQEIPELRVIGSEPEFRELKRKLSEAISRGYVEQIAIMKPNKLLPNQEWYRDKETGGIYYLVQPDERAGWWDRVDPKS